MIRVALISAILLTLAVPASATRLEDAVSAMRVGDYAEAFCIMRPMAEEGDADAQYNIGWMYHNGYGLRINDSLALEWWSRAAAQGHTDASFSIGMLYSLGEREVPRDLQRAIDAYLVAAADNHDDAIAILKTMMERNARAIRPRLHAIMEHHASLFGKYRRVKANKLNARSGPSTESGIVTQLVKDDWLLVLREQGKWSQIVTLQDTSVDRTVWVYSPLLRDPQPVQRTQG